MEELLVAITRGLVDQPDAVTVEVDQPDEEGVIVYHLHVAESDMGRVAAARITTRMAFAIRPCLPMTRPISLSAPCR